MRAEVNSIRVWDFALQKLTALTFGPGLDQSPVWTPDGRRVLFASNRAGTFNVYVQNADGTGPAERITGGPSSLYPTATTSDGSRVVVNELLNNQVGIGMVPLTNPVRRTLVDGTDPLLNTPYEEVAAQISPDGRYVAYQSNESGHFEVYVRPFPNVTGGRWQVSTEGGSNPMWARSGTELFFLDGATAMLAVPVQMAGGKFTTGHPKTLFDARIYTADGTRAYDVSPDGQRFILIKDGTADSKLSPEGMLVVLDWLEDLKVRLPGRPLAGQS